MDAVVTLQDTVTFINECFLPFKGNDKLPTVIFQICGFLEIVKLFAIFIDQVCTQFGVKLFLSFLIKEIFEKLLKLLFL